MIMMCNSSVSKIQNTYIDPILHPNSPLTSLRCLSSGLDPQPHTPPAFAPALRPPQGALLAGQ